MPTRTTPAAPPVTESVSEPVGGQADVPANGQGSAGQVLDPKLRTHLLDHTLRVLLRDGYRRFSMMSVATSAKSSKETLYRYFGDKNGLMRAALVRSATQIAPLLLQDLDTADRREDRLRQLGRNYLHACFTPESLALQRIACSDGEQGLGPLFAEEITDRAIAVVEAEFDAIGSVRPRQDAELFLGMIQGKLHERIMLGAEIEDIERRIDAQVDHALQVMTPYLDSVPPRS